MRQLVFYYQNSFILFIANKACSRQQANWPIKKQIKLDLFRNQFKSLKIHNIFFKKNHNFIRHWKPKPTRLVTDVIQSQYFFKEYLFQQQGTRTPMVSHLRTSLTQQSLMTVRKFTCRDSRLKTKCHVIGRKHCALEQSTTDSCSFSAYIFD